MRILSLSLLALSAIVVSACSSVPLGTHITKRAFNKPAPYHAPPVTVKRKIGNPYKIGSKWYYPIDSSEGYNEKGIASWYGKEFHGRKTANGEIYNMYDMTAAHPTLPLPTYVRVTNLDNGRSAVVKVNDRGPFLRGRLIDMSFAGSQALGFTEQGTAPVLVEALPTDGSMLRRARQQVAQAEGTTPEKVKGSFTTRIATKKDVAEEDVPDSTQVSEVSVEPTPAEAKVALEEAEEIVKHPVRIYVQTGAFTNKANALRQRDKLLKTYNNVHSQEAIVDGKDFYRVRIGPLATVDVADEVLARLEHIGYAQAIIVVEQE